MNQYEKYTDEKLIEMLRKGEDDVMEYILEKYKPLVRKKTNAMYLIGGESDDLIQEGMIGLFKAVRDYCPNKETSFFTFANLCINRQLYSALEASNRKKHQPLNSYISFSIEEGEMGISLDEIFSDNSTSPEDLVIEQEKFKEFMEKLDDKLSKMERNVLNMYLNGDNYLQIAQIMNKEPKSIDNALQRIRQKIRTLKYDGK
ncbi:MAG: sigma-70 family RNA polymerase sigma factor [Agathobacter sp.]|nr:sigma-70 family RNA polymerase sigma factor [Agathobacter sp.]